MSSAICFNLDQSKILSSGNELSSTETMLSTVRNECILEMIYIDQTKCAQILFVAKLDFYL